MTDDDLEATKLKAYHIWDREGRPHGRDVEHWQHALAEFRLDRAHHDARAAIAAQARDWDASEEA